MKSQVWWYTARAGGTMAWALSAVSVVWGLLLSSRVLGKRISGPKLLDLHRFLGGLAVVFTGVHLAGLFFDSYVHFGFRELFIPFASDWQPNAVAWGVVALYLLVAVEVTSLLRRRVGERVWRVTHYLGFVVFVFGTIHGLKAGTDVSNPVLWWPAAGLSAAIIGLCVARVSVNGDPVPTGGGIRVSRADETAPTSAAEPDTKLSTTKAERRSATPEIYVLERTLEGLLGLDEAPPMVTSAVGAPAPSHNDPPAATPTIAAPSPAYQSTVDHATADHAIWSAPVVESHFVPTEPLPVRAPHRYAATTEPATSLTSWQPATSYRRDELTSSGSVASGISTVERTWIDTPTKATPGAGDAAGAHRPAGPPLPPTEVDPATGEPDPQAYRKWLKEWLAYVESQV